MSLLHRAIFRIERNIEKERLKRLKRQMKHCGNNVTIYPSVTILVPERMEIGDNSSIAPYTVIYATFGIKIGKNCLISSNCGLSSYNHIQNSAHRPLDTAQDHKFSKSITIGDNVWIGMNACILPGVVIGDHSIIGSGSVVTRNVPEGEIWVGNPARFVRKLDI